jgi:hypothetical protein
MKIILNRNFFLKLNNIELIMVAELGQDKNTCRRILHIDLIHLKLSAFIFRWYGYLWRGVLPLSGRLSRVHLQHTEGRHAGPTNSDTRDKPAHYRRPFCPRAAGQPVPCFASPCSVFTIRHGHLSICIIALCTRLYMARFAVLSLLG